jgi:hypothetical protein
LEFLLFKGKHSNWQFTKVTVADPSWNVSVHFNRHLFFAGFFIISRGNFIDHLLERLTVLEVVFDDGN